MNRKQHELLMGRKVIEFADLQDKSERTLLWGYTCDRASFHVYVKDEEIKVVMYFSDKDIEELNIQYNSQYVPDKRLYPEACDYEFCSLLAQDGVNLPFTTFNDEREPKQYHGKVL